jgi:hypothetical protein
LPLTIQPYYVNSTHLAPYGNSTLLVNGSSSAATPLTAPTPTTLAYSGYENGLYFTNWSVP